MLHSVMRDRSKNIPRLRSDQTKAAWFGLTAAHYTTGEKQAASK